MMLFSSVCASLRRYSAYSLLTGLLLLMPIAIVRGQGGVGSNRGLPAAGGGSNIIQGRVVFPSAPKGGKRLKVRLESTDLVNQTTSTDDDGLFFFNGLQSGHFTITIDGGDEFDNAVEQVNIDRATGNFNVSIMLKAKGTAAAVSKIPKSARDLYTKGIESVNKGDSKKAIEQFNAAIAIYPEFAQAYADAGAQYMKLGQPDKAAESLQSALKYAPDDFGIRLNYGIALLQQKKFPEAETTLREVLAKNESLPTAHMYLGIALFSQKKLDEAEKEFLRAGTLNDTETAVSHRYLGGIYWGDKDYQRAADELEKYLKLVPNAADAARTRDAIKELRSKK